MRKAASIFLRACERRRDLDNMIYWLKNPEVTRFLNEDAGVISYLSRLADTVPEPMLTFHLNAMGRFFMICLEDGTAVGFVKLAKTAARIHMRSSMPSERIRSGVSATERPPSGRRCI